MVAANSMEGVSPDALVRALTELADRHAVLAANWLASTGLSPGPLRLPEAFLLELAAVLQLSEWERTGVASHLDVNLPHYREAANELAVRARLGPEEFQGLDATQLSVRVNTVWIERFAWDGYPLLQADIVIADCDEDALVERIAEFLWQNYLELQQLLVSEAGNEHE